MLVEQELVDSSPHDRLPHRPKDGTAGLSFCDLSSFYSPAGGGIRTYHQAKLEWFGSQTRHRYCLIYPGPRFAIDRVAPAVTIVTIRGLPVRAGYRLPTDIRRLQAFIKALRPDVLETGDPWISGPLGLLFKRWGYTPLVSSFYHADPIHTYVEPWSARGNPVVDIRRRLRLSAERHFFRLQRTYDLTLTSSAWVEEMLRGRGIARILRAPFGVDPIFLETGRARTGWGRRGRLLYVGRLQNDKAFDLLIDAIPELLRRPDVELTVVGAGPEAARLTALGSPRLHIIGYVSSRISLAEIYAEHDVLLAPGPNETFGLGALEGLASGLSVVGPDAGGTWELLRALTSPHLFKRDDRGDFVRAVWQATDANGVDEARAGVAVAERYGTWSQAITREIEGYCKYLSRCTT